LVTEMLAALALLLVIKATAPSRKERKRAG
jgi:hypothetical protein